jgi:hypothetical protein
MAPIFGVPDRSSQNRKDKNQVARLRADRYAGETTPEFPTIGK